METGGGIATFSNWQILALNTDLTELSNTVVPESRINDIAYHYAYTQRNNYAMETGRTIDSSDFMNSDGVVDFDLITKSGVYRFNNQTSYLNAPPCSWGQLLVLHSAGDTIAQMAFNFSSDVGQFFVRVGNPPSCYGSGRWYSWAKFEGTTVS